MKFPPHFAVIAILATVALTAAYVVIYDTSTSGQAVAALTCTDSDGGVNAYAAGVTSVKRKAFGIVLLKKADVCSGGNVAAVKEYSCNPASTNLLNSISEKTIACNAGDACVAGACKCTPKTCAAMNATCGSISNGCGGTLQCGNCTNGATCTNNNQCLFSVSSGGQAACMAPECPAGQKVNYTGTTSGDHCQDFNCIPNQSNTSSPANQTCTATTCAAKNATCGNISNGCGGTLQCGSCATNQVCSSNRCTLASSGNTSNNQSSPSNQTTCNAETNSSFCSRLNATCGSKSANDNCGTSRTVNCGNCASGYSCNSINKCECAPESPSQFCANRGKNCGTLSATDNCGNARSVDCSSFNTQPCGSCVNNVCQAAGNQSGNNS